VTGSCTGRDSSSGARALRNGPRERDGSPLCARCARLLPT
jgi:hypothetical protein